MDRALDAFDRRLNPGQRAPLAVALSGGSDSTALLLLTLRWARAHVRAVLALSVDHQLQPDSAAWSGQALDLAARLGAQTQRLVWSGDKPATGLPAAARRARLGLLADAARAAGAGVILLGHTRDDLAEAQVMRDEGSTVGSPGEWTPSPLWPQGRRLFHFRPLLSERRESLRGWLREQGAGWVEDPANQDPKYARARARAALAGGLGDEVEAARVEDVSGLAAICEADPWGGLSVPQDALRGPGGRRVLQAMLACASGREIPPKGARVEALLARLGQGARLAVLGGARVEADNGLVRVTREAGERARGGLADRPLTPGRPVVWDGRFELSGDAAGTIGPLAGLSGALGADERRRLKAVPAGARGALPVLTPPGGDVTCPLLATVPGLDCRVLTGERLRAACGLIAQEE